MLRPWKDLPASIRAQRQAMPSVLRQRDVLQHPPGLNETQNEQIEPMRHLAPDRSKHPSKYQFADGMDVAKHDWRWVSGRLWDVSSQP